MGTLTAETRDLLRKRFDKAVSRRLKCVEGLVLGHNAFVRHETNGDGSGIYFVVDVRRSRRGRKIRALGTIVATPTISDYQ